MGLLTAVSKGGGLSGGGHLSSPVCSTALFCTPDLYQGAGGGLGFIIQYLDDLLLVGSSAERVSADLLRARSFLEAGE